MSTFHRRLEERARALGISTLGIVPALPSPYLDTYLHWIESGMHGTMSYLAREDRVARRKDLTLILPGARSLVVVTFDYFSTQLSDAIDPWYGRISNYAWGADYHDVMLHRLSELTDFLKTEAGAPITTRAYVDTGPILERAHATQAGLGFVGKNTMLIHPRRGSFFFLGQIITDLELECDEVHGDAMPGCGTCKRCLTACPTNAFPAPYILDARRCISYLTIEHSGFFPPALRHLMGNWIYGCDVCQNVCPWQRFAKPAHQDIFAPPDLERAKPYLPGILALDDDAFAERFKGSPIFRIGRERLVRNACVAAGNSGVPDLGESLVPLLRDESALVRGHTVWALGRLQVGRDELYAALRREDDESVRAEIEAALNL